MSADKKANRGSRCPISFALDLLGDRWSLLVVRDLLLFGKQRFSEFHTSGEGIATNILSDRLKRLEQGGLVQSAADPEDGRRVLYSVTQKGADLLPTLLELIRWGARHDPDTGVPADFLDRLENDREALVQEIQERVRPS